jgi:DNA polymerase-3 subunit chi
VTEVAFHFGAPDKLGYACRLLRKAVGSGAKVLVVADEVDLQQLDVDLWAMLSTDFVPHCSNAADIFVQKKCPVVLASQIDSVLDQKQVLVNLAQTVVEGFEKFMRVIEVVSTDDRDRDLARLRWKHYTALGYTITRHDLTLQGAN